MIGDAAGDIGHGRVERYAKTTRRAVFHAEMEMVVPGWEFCALVEPFYPKAGNGRPPVGLERMLRIYLLQQWFNLSDRGVEEALYDSQTMRGFVGVDLGREPVPDETTICNFRHLLERHDLGRRLFEAVHRHLEARGVRISAGTIVDATIINAPSSTKNKDRARDPDMHQTRKGQQWYFGMKAHFGVEAAPRSSTRLRQRRSTSPPPRFFPIYCMAMRRGCGATRLIEDNAGPSERVLHAREISPIAAIATAA